jgi:Ca2+-binding RTX toxin-like protein
MWLMDGTTIANGQFLPGPVPVGWNVVDAHGDYNGDGKSDLLWRGPQGQTVLWQMDGTSVAQNSSLSGAIPLGASIAGESGALLLGDAGNNLLFGSDAMDTLRGGAGADTLRGMAGADRFVFDAPLNAGSNVDTVLDFTPAEDKLVLSEVIFTNLPAGLLSAGSFVSGSNPVAQDANDFVLYNTGTGQVSYDADGSGPASAIAFATLFGNPTLTANDLNVIADAA